MGMCGSAWACECVYVSVCASGHVCMPARLCTRGRLYEYTYTFNHTCAGPWNSFCALLGARRDPKDISCGPQHMFYDSRSVLQGRATCSMAHTTRSRTAGDGSSPTCHGRVCVSVCLLASTRACACMCTCIHAQNHVCVCTYKWHISACT